MAKGVIKDGKLVMDREGTGASMRADRAAADRQILDAEQKALLKKLELAAKNNNVQQFNSILGDISNYNTIHAQSDRKFIDIGAYRNETTGNSILMTAIDAMPKGKIIGDGVHPDSVATRCYELSVNKTINFNLDAKDNNGKSALDHMLAWRDKNYGNAAGLLKANTLDDQDLAVLIYSHYRTTKDRASYLNDVDGGRGPISQFGKKMFGPKLDDWYSRIDPNQNTILGDVIPSESGLADYNRGNSDDKYLFLTQRGGSGR